MVKILHVGIESWTFGPNKTLYFPFTLGDGSADVSLLQIIGTVSGARQSGSNGWTNQCRQALIALYSRSLMGAPDGHVGAKPQPSNFEVENGIHCWNIKQMGNEVIHIPVNVAFAKPLTIPKGSIEISVNAESGSSTDDVECLDTEVHLSFLFEVG